jgi:UDP-glucose 4-epimerase
VKVLVTGGAGFVGSHVVDRLLDHGHAVCVLDNLSTGRRELVNPRADLRVCDLRSAHLDGLVGQLAPEGVVHLAAQAAVSRSVEDPMLDASVNVLGTIALLEASRRAGVRDFVYISTGGAGYGDTDVVPTPEDHPLRPSSPYGVSKTSAERYVDCWAGLASGLRTVIVRLANVYGPRQNPEGEAGVVAIFGHRLVTGAPCVVNGDGEQTRDYVYVEDVAAAVARALEQAVSGSFNIGTGVETTVNELYRRLAGVAGITQPPQYGPARPGEQRRSALDNRRARSLLGWSPVTSLEDGLRRTLSHIRHEVSAAR